MTPHARLPNWERSLEEYINSRRNSMLRFGRHDCALFVAGAVHSITGIDYAEDFRGTYRTRDEAHDLLRRLGGAEKVVDQYFTRIDRAYVWRGDIVFGYDDLLDDTLGVCVVSMGRMMWVTPAARGLVFREMDQAMLAWRV